MTIAPAPVARVRGPVRRRRRLAQVLLVMLAVLVGAEVLARAAATRLDDDYPFVVGPVEDHLANLRRIEQTEGGVDVLVIGSSAAGAAIDPTLLTSAAPELGTAYNAWLAGAAMPAIDLAARELFVPEAEPSRVVIALTSRELNDATAGRDRTEEALRSSLGFRYRQGAGGVAGAVTRFAYDRSALLQHRHRVREPLLLVQELIEGADEDDPIDEFGMLTDRLEVERLTLSERHLEFERDALADYDVGGPNLQRLRELIDWLQRRDVEVVVVNLPVWEPVYVPLHPGGSRDHARYEQVLEALTAELGVRYVDATGGPLTESHFGDENHVNRRGATTVTQHLADALPAS